MLRLSAEEFATDPMISQSKWAFVASFLLVIRGFEELEDSMRHHQDEYMSAREIYCPFSRQKHD